MEVFNKLESFFKDGGKSVYTLETSITAIVVTSLLKTHNLYVYQWRSRQKYARFTQKNRINR